MKVKFFIISLFLLAGALSAQMRDASYWLTLETGKAAFRQGRYADAISAFETARLERDAYWTRQETVLIAALSTPEARVLKDSLSQLELYIADKHIVDARAALDALYFRVPKSKLNDSSLQALAMMGNLKVYPDAEYWLAESYRLEGENSLALKQYKIALSQKEWLDVPAFESEIIYRIADIQYETMDYVSFENTLEDFLKGNNHDGTPRDALWTEGEDKFISTALLRAMEDKTLDQFLRIYRYSNPGVLRAHQELGFYYLNHSRHHNAEKHLTFAFMIISTKIIEELIKKDFEYNFNGMEDMISRALAVRPIRQ
jgi:tetratricopeptide (TPR) repeat protein